MDLLSKRIVEQVREKAQARSAEQIAKGVMSKDTKQAISESTATMSRMREAMQDVVAKTISERTPDNIPSRISEPVLEGAPEKPEMGSREPYELEVDTIGNEALDSSGRTEISKDEADYETGKKLREEALKNKGIMSPTDGDADGVQPTDGKDTELDTYTNDFANVYLTQHEGLQEHKSLEGGKDTGALGVKFSLGLKREDYTSDSEYAAAVAMKHRDKAKSNFTESEWNELPQSVKYAITDLHYNVGKIGSTADKDTTVNKMENTLEFVGMSTKDKKRVSLISLAKRRAWNWNKAAADMGVSEIAKIKQIPIKGGTKFEYLDSNDNVVYSFSNNRTPVKLDSTGKATTLTTTREINL